MSRSWGLVFNNFLNRAALVVITIALALAILTAVKPLKEPVKLPREGEIELRSSSIAKVGGVAVVVMTVVLYIVFA
jgi:SSS family solute:Na+ symporter